MRCFGESRIKPGRDDKTEKSDFCKGKGGKTRVILIISWKTGPIFLRNRHRAMSLRSVNHIVAALGTQAGIANPNPRLTHLNPHLFRHLIAHFLKSKRSVQSGFRTFWGMSRTRPRWTVWHAFSRYPRADARG